MTLQTVPIPTHYSADIGYKVLRPLMPYLQSAKTLFNAGNITALQGKQMLNGLQRIMEAIQQAYDGGELDGDASWKSLAADTLTQINGFLSVVNPMMLNYSNQAGQLITTRAQDVANGANLPLLDSDSALGEIMLTSADINTVVTELTNLGA